MIRLETHCHTKYSKDSMLPFSLLYLKCRLCHIDWIAITEHNNIQGAVEFKKYCEKKKDKLHVIIGEEIMTFDGEVIGLFLKEEIPAGLSCDETITRIQKQDGIVYVPHPYDEKRAKTVLKEERIKNSLDFVIGSDAHTVWEIGRNYMMVNCIPDSPEAFKQAIKCATFHKRKCLKFSHKITKLVKLLRMLKKGNFNEIYRVIKKRFGRTV